MEFTQTTKPTKKTKPVKQQSTVAEEQSAVVKEETAVVEEQPAPTEVRLVDIPIENENVALNVMVGFLNVAHKRGAFTIDESAKIWECISTFQKK